MKKEAKKCIERAEELESSIEQRAIHEAKLVSEFRGVKTFADQTTGQTRKRQRQQTGVHEANPGDDWQHPKAGRRD